ncbi:MAG TPA: SGNH/GDSL hydrolase family protein, partial [Anaerolineaceae bacterium]
TVIQGFRNQKAEQLTATTVLQIATMAPTTPPAPTQVISPTLSASGLNPDPTQTPLPKPTLNPVDWESQPIIPEISRNVREIYLKGIALGNHPNVFSKVGDCNSLPPYFLTYFDLDSSAYDLGSYAFLQPAVDQFSGSFNHKSLAVGDGFNTSSVLSSIFADQNNCGSNESPLACEYRTQKPSFAIISIGTDDYVTPAIFEINMRKILVTTINMGIVPILITKMDDANQLNDNLILTKLAGSYDIPLINLWRAMQPLPENGLQDKIHPTGITDAFIFSPDNLTRYGWPVRNLTVLQALNTTWRAAAQP